MTTPRTTDRTSTTTPLTADGPSTDRPALTSRSAPAPGIVTLEDALEASQDQALRWYAEAVNPVQAADAHLFAATGTFVRGDGAVLTDDRGVEYLDALAGFGSVNLGHGHPEVADALDRVADLPGFVQVWPSPVMPALAASLAAVAPGDLGRVFLCNSGTEAVEAALKLVRAASPRAGLLSTVGAFHGKSFGALSVSGREVYKRPFGPLLPGCEQVPFGDVEAVEQALAKGRFAAFVVEPIQGEAGVIVPPDGYLRAVRRACDETGTLLVLDEVQTGMGRTGTLFACEREAVVPDVLCLAKGLGGGLLPIGACIARTPVWDRVYGSRDAAYLHTSTFGGGTRACAVALRTLEVMVRDRVPEQAARTGQRLLTRLTELAGETPLLAEVRGRGLLIGIGFAVPRLGAGFARAHAGEVVASLLWQEHHVLTLNTLHNPNVLRIEPPLTITDAEADRIADALTDVARRHRSVLGATVRVGLRGLRGRTPSRARP
jgi:putrescine aminotransferase